MSWLKTGLRSAWADRNISHKYSGFPYLQMISIWQEEWKLAVLCHLEKCRAVLSWPGQLQALFEENPQ